MEALSSHHVLPQKSKMLSWHAGAAMQRNVSIEVDSPFGVPSEAFRDWGHTPTEDGVSPPPPSFFLCLDGTNLEEAARRRKSGLHRECVEDTQRGKLRPSKADRGSSRTGGDEFNSAWLVLLAPSISQVSAAVAERPCREVGAVRGAAYLWLLPFCLDWPRRLHCASATRVASIPLHEHGSTCGRNLQWVSMGNKFVHRSARYACAGSFFLSLSVSSGPLI